MFIYKQSSLWFVSNGNNFSKYNSRPLGNSNKASVLFPISGGRWGQTGEKESARRVLLHMDGVTGGMYLRDPKGGVAYGTPKKASTGGWLKCCCNIIPRKGPYLVTTTRVLYLCTSKPWSVFVSSKQNNTKMKRRIRRNVTATWRRNSMSFFGQTHGRCLPGPRRSDIAFFHASIFSFTMGKIASLYRAKKLFFPFLKLFI